MSTTSWGGGGVGERMSLAYLSGRGLLLLQEQFLHGHLCLVRCRRRCRPARPSLRQWQEDTLFISNQICTLTPRQ